MQELIRNRVVLLVGLPLVGLAVGFVLQYSAGIEPCILCELQRYCLMMLVLFGLGASAKRCLSWALSGYVFFYLLGFCLALRHSWLVHFSPPNGETCLPDLITLWHLSSWSSWWQQVLGSSGCGHDMPVVLGIALPDWVLVLYVAIAVSFWSQRRSSGA